MKGLAFAFVLLSLASGLMTYQGVEAGASELNGIMAWVVGQGWAWFWLVKIGLTAFLVWWVSWAFRTAPGIQRAVMIGLEVFFAGLCAWNMSQLVMQ